MSARSWVGVRTVSWEQDPWCLNGWFNGEPHYCHRDFGHDGRCVCDCRSWTVTQAALVDIPLDADRTEEER